MMEILQYTPLFYPLGHSGGPREDKGQAHVRRVDEGVPVSTLLTPREANFPFTSAGKSFPAPSSKSAVCLGKRLDGQLI